MLRLTLMQQHIRRPSPRKHPVPLRPRGPLRSRGVLAICLLLSSAAATLPQAAPSGRGEAEVAFRSGMRLQVAGKLAEAQRSFEKAHSLAPHDLAITTALARIDAVLGRNDAAVLLFEEIVQTAPSVSAHQLDLAVALASRGSLADALPPATRAVELDRKSVAAHHIRGKILAALDRPNQAQAEFDAALTLNPADPLTLYDNALLCESQNQLPQEIALLRRLNRAVPSRSEFHFLLGRALSRTRDQAARDELREAIRLDPANRAALYALSRELKADDPQESARLAERFHSLRVSEDELNVIRTAGNAGVAAMSRKDWSVAIAAFKSALSTCAGCTLEATLEKDLGLAECQSGDTVAGASSLRRALALNPRDLDTLQALELAEKNPATHP